MSEYNPLVSWETKLIDVQVVLAEPFYYTCKVASVNPNDFAPNSLGIDRFYLVDYTGKIYQITEIVDAPTQTIKIYDLTEDADEGPYISESAFVYQTRTGINVLTQAQRKRLHPSAMDQIWNIENNIIQNNLYLRLDQTTPQTIVNGIPLTNWQLSDFVSSNQLVNKEYVDSVVNFSDTFFFNNTASDIGGIYYKMLDMSTGETTSTFVSSALAAGNDQNIYNFATESNVPGSINLKSGLYVSHIHAKKDSAGAKPAQIYFRIYTRTSGGVETLRATSEVSEELTSSISDYTLHATIVSDIDILVTDRILIKWYVNVGSTGTNVTVTLYAEGTYSSRLTIPTTTEVLSSIFLRQDGTKPLTGHWNIGNTYRIDIPTSITIDTISEYTSANGVWIDGLGIKDTGINFEVGATTRIFKDGSNNLSFTDAMLGTKTLTELYNNVASHAHGNITNAGAIGSTAGLMVKTTTDGVLTVLAAGSSGQFLRYDGTWDTPAGGTDTGIMKIVKAEVLYTNTTKTTIITLPTNAVIWNVAFEEVVAFNDTGGTALYIGTSASDYEYAYQNLAGSEPIMNDRIKPGLFTSYYNIPVRMTTSTGITFLYVGTNNDATQGQVFVYIYYSLH